MARIMVSLAVSFAAIGLAGLLTFAEPMGTEHASTMQNPHASLRQTSSSLPTKAPDKVEPPQCKETIGNLVATGPYHTCARNWSSSVGEISCFGWNEFGQAKLNPLSLSIDGKALVAVQVASGTRHTCAIATSDKVSVCDGGGVDNGWICDAAHKCEGGQCKLLAVRPQDNSSAVTGANIFCWGSDSHGQAPQNLAARLASSSTAAASQCCEAAASSGKAASRDAGASECQCPRSALEGDKWRLPKKPTRICAGGMHTCVLWEDGTVFCFGCRGCEHNQTAVPAAAQGKTLDITCGMRHSCARLASEEVLCWGDNDFLQSSAPPALRARSVSAGEKQSEN